MQDVFLLAKKAREYSYSPYSGFAVGAAVKLKDSEEIICGCNVENSSYGGTVCAERVAILSAIAQFGRVAFDCLVVVTDICPPALPCAICLGVLAEFCQSHFPIYLATLEKIEYAITLGELLPQPFVLAKKTL